MFRKPKRNEQDNVSEDLNKGSFSNAVAKIYQARKITLAIARVSYFERVEKAKEGNCLDSFSDNFLMNGVIHENDQFDIRIQCNIEFINSKPDDKSIGWCCLTYLIDENQNKPPEHRTLSLTGKIYDPDAVLRNKVYNVIRDAAFSGNQFCHFQIVTDEQDAVKAQEAFVLKGSGPDKKILQFKMWPEIILPNAPV